MYPELAVSVERRPGSARAWTTLVTLSHGVSATARVRITKPTAAIFRLMEAGGNGETGSVLATRIHDLDPVRTHDQHMAAKTVWETPGRKIKLYFLTAGGRHGPITAHARFQWVMGLNTKPESAPIRNLAEC